MPFTPSHAAAVLPLRRLALPMSGLVIGSMIPDLPYYVPLPISSEFTHTLTGVLTIDVAMGLLCVGLWHLLLAPAAVALAPTGARRRLKPDAPQPVREVLGSARGVAGSAVALVIGAITHVVWDSFTHVGRFGPRHIAWLAQPHGVLDGYRWAQYASGLFGAAVIAAYLGAWWRTPADDAGQHADPGLGLGVRLQCARVLAGGLAVGAVAGWLVGQHQQEGLRHTVFLVATASGGTAAALALLASISLRLSDRI